MTSSAASPPQPPTGHEERIRRNVACVNCRNSKVRCRASAVAGHPCQRCAKLELACVVDKSHKRVTKRSKLEQLEQELKTIRQAVNPKLKPNGEGPSRATRSSPRVNIYIPFTEQFKEPAPPPPAPQPARLIFSVAKRPYKATQTKPRTIGYKVVDGPEIDRYFDRFLESFYPFVPILRSKDPDDCYDACPTLFWVVVLTACRSYCPDPDLYTMLIETVAKDIWTLLANPILSLELVHALLIVCAYPFPTIRFVTDPSTTFASLAMNTCMVLGLHTGKGSHKEFCVGSRQHLSCTDEEASSTWLLACIFAQKSSSMFGHPPPSIQSFDAPAKRVLSASPEWADLIAVFDIQKFLNRMHTSMAAQISAHGSVLEPFVSNWEEEFESVQALISTETDISRFMLITAKLEIQCYYFAYPSDSPGPNLTLNTSRAFTTAKSIINTALALNNSSSSSSSPPSLSSSPASPHGPSSSSSSPSSPRFLTSAPQWAFRAVVDSACLIVSSLHSHNPPTTVASVSRHHENALAQQVVSAVAACSVREGDLAQRAVALLEAFWSTRDIIPRTDVPIRTWTSRLAGGLALWCLFRLNGGLKQAKEQSENNNSNRAAAAAAAVQTRPVNRTQSPDVQVTDASSTTEQQLSQPLPPVTEFPDLDLSMFLDEFGWNAGGDDPVFLGLP